MNKRDKIRYFEDRSNTLRKEVKEAIIEMLRENNLTELYLSQDDEHPVYVVWFDNDSNGYDSRVYAIRLTDEGFELELDGSESNESTHTISCRNGDFACNNIDWLIAILDNMYFTLSLPESKGEATIEGQIVHWSYQERGLSELPQSEKEFVVRMLKEGKTNGSLYYNDNDVEFEGQWHIATELSAKEKIESLRKNDQQVGLRMNEFIRAVIKENGGRLTYSMPEEADEDDYPVSLNLRGEIWNYNFYITSIYLNEEGGIMADGFEMLDGVRHDSSQAVESEHYPLILDFITETLNIN